MSEQEFRDRHGEKIFQINNVAWELLQTSANGIKSVDWFKAVDYLVTEIKAFVTDTLVRQGDSQSSKELNKVITAGDELAQAAHRVQSDYDGIHRLRLALSNWYKVRADESHRNKLAKEENL